MISSEIFLISDNPEETAERDLKFISDLSAIIFARVVLPVPGGPQKIIDGMVLFWIRLYKGFPLPNICSWPTKSSIFFGLILDDNGDDESDSFLPVYSNKSIK